MLLLLLLRGRRFATAEEAALTYARHIGREAACVEEAAAPSALARADARASLLRGDVDMTAAEALAAAEAEGLPLLVNSSGSKSGFKHVSQVSQVLRRSWRLEEEGDFLGCGCLGKRA